MNQGEVTGSKDSDLGPEEPRIVSIRNAIVGDLEERYFRSPDPQATIEIVPGDLTRVVNHTINRLAAGNLLAGEVYIQGVDEIGSQIDE